MPDTGAPWNIPYVESTDLVSDWPADSLALANAIDAGLDSAGVAGIGTNAVSAASNTQLLTSSTSFVDCPGLSVTITPTSATSKVLIIVQLSHGVGRTGDGWEARINGGNAGNYGRSTGGSVFGGSTSNSGDGDRRQLYSGSMVYLDSPATTSATTYKAQIRKAYGAGASVNRSVEVTSRAGASSITAIEVKV